MQAMIIEHFGDPHVFQPKTIPKPTLKPGYVLIKTAATNFNPFDYNRTSCYPISGTFGRTRVYNRFFKS